MPTLEDHRRAAEDTLRAAARRREAAHAEAKAILDLATREGRATVHPHEDTRLTTLFAARDAAQADEAAAADRLSRIGAIEAEEREAAARTAQTRPGAGPVTRESRARIGMEERTYRPDEDPKGAAFIRDVCANFLYRDPGASERLARHSQEERVNRPGWAERADTSTTANYVGLVVPQYLTDFYAPAVAALRPLADHANHHELPPSGMSVNISKITTPTTAALQASELAAVSGTGADDTLLTIPVLTAAGENTVSRQALERGTGVENTVVSDLMRRIATVLDSTIINQAGTGLLAVGQTTTYTDAAPTPQLLYPNIFKSESLLEQALLGVAVPDYIVMHPRRWNWFVSVLGTSWPLIGGQGVPAQSGGVTLTNEYGSGVRGVLPNGLKVIVDANLPTNLGAGTNQDPILVVASEEVNVWEDPNAPVLIRAEQPQAASLGVLLVAYTYFAYTASRYTNNPGIINGTGVIAPAGF